MRRVRGVGRGGLKTGERVRRGVPGLEGILHGGIPARNMKNGLSGTSSGRLASTPNHARI